ncbi:MAG: 23S rRNA (adenine(2503)-C(2))-methyltransferase RlmN [Spirochaetota bacterium]
MTDTTTPNPDTSLCGLLPAELSKKLEISPRFRGDQLFQWIHQKGVSDFSQMSNLPAALREELAELYSAPVSSQVETLNKDEDGTVKVTIRLHDGALIEAVLLGDESGRKTACLSSQVGCGLGCTFCKTATMGFIRNLSAGEIVEQFLHLKQRYGDIANIVFMGMGEPLLNFDEVAQAIEVLHHPEGHNIGMRKITISTSGILEGIHRLADEGPHIRLALSLISADQQLREELMPIARSTPLGDLQKALLHYQKSTGKRITLEYVLFHGLNTGKQDLQALQSFIRPLRVLVNIIPWNPVEGLPYSEPQHNEIAAFTQMLEAAGIKTSRRFRRGRGINGACGQLAVPRNKQTQ